MYRDVHLLQFDSAWSLERWTKHIQRVCRKSDEAPKALVFKVKGRKNRLRR